jgi:hypothetical protein
MSPTPKVTTSTLINPKIKALTWKKLISRKQEISLSVIPVTNHIKAKHNTQKKKIQKNIPLSKGSDNTVSKMIKQGHHQFMFFLNNSLSLNGFYKKK